MKLEFSNSFLERKPARHLSNQELKRIAEAYKRTKSDPRCSLPEYTVGNEWAPIYNRYMGDFIQALQMGDIDLLRDQLENFFRRPFSNGLHGLHFEMTERYMTPSREISTEDASAYVQTVSADLERIILSLPHIDISKIETPIAGNPYGFEINGNFVSGLHFLYFSEKIRALLGTGSIRIIELGGGYGGMAWAIKSSTPDAKYINVDLPEVLAISSFYALSCMPEIKIGLYGEVDVSDEDATKDFDMLFMPSFEIESIKSNWADLAFNTWSLAEMDPVAIKNYVNQLCRISSKYIFHVNHTKNCVMSSDYFPIDFEKFQLVHRSPAMWGKSTSRNNWIDEHEFIYRAKKLQNEHTP